MDPDRVTVWIVEFRKEGEDAFRRFDGYFSEEKEAWDNRDWLWQNIRRVEQVRVIALPPRR
jgi:hypothetical protein